MKCDWSNFNLHFRVFEQLQPHFISQELSYCGYKIPNTKFGLARTDTSARLSFYKKKKSRSLRRNLVKTPSKRTKYQIWPSQGKHCCQIIALQQARRVKPHRSLFKTQWSTAILRHIRGQQVIRTARFSLTAPMLNRDR